MPEVKVDITEAYQTYFKDWPKSWKVEVEFDEPRIILTTSCKEENYQKLLGIYQGLALAIDHGFSYKSNFVKVANIEKQKLYFKETDVPTIAANLVVEHGPSCSNMHSSFEKPLYGVKDQVIDEDPETHKNIVDLKKVYQTWRKEVEKDHYWGWELGGFRKEEEPGLETKEIVTPFEKYEVVGIF